MALVTFSPNTKIKSADINSNFATLADGSNDLPANSLRTTRQIALVNFVASGLALATSANLTTNLIQGLGVVNGKYLPLVTTPITVAASKDTYLDLKDDGTIVQVPVANGATTGMVLTLNSDGTPTLRIAKLVSSATAITTVQQYDFDPLGNHIFNQNPSSYSSGIQSLSQITISTTTTLISLTLANAPAGDYLITSHFSCMPSGGANGSVTFTTSGTNGTWSFNNNIGSGVHAADADWSTTKWLHRYPSNRLRGHQGGTFTINMVFTPESSSNFVFNNANDARWGTSIHALRV